MNTYTAYGFGIRSEVVLPELVSGSTTTSVEIRRGDLRRVEGELRAEGTTVRISRAEIWIHWPGVCLLAVREGREIILDDSAAGDPRVVRSALLGPGFAALLQQRGFLILHASAVLMGSGGVAFVGRSGSGKSTLAASLHARGYPLIVDDILALRHCGDELLAFPGFPYFRLWPETVRALGESPEELPLLNSLTEKRSRRIESEFQAHRAVPIRSLYLLAFGDALEVAPLTPHEALLELVAQSYGIGWLHPISGPDSLAQRAEVVRRVPVHRLVRPKDLDRMPEVIRRIELGCAPALQQAS